MMGSTISRMPTALKRLGAIGAWLILWQLASWAIGNPLLFCGPVEALEALLHDVITPASWLTIGWSAGRIAAGFALACILGLALGGIAGRSEVARAFLAPALHAMKSTPIVCVIALLLVWCGSGLATSIAVGLVVLPPFYFAMLEAHSAADPAIGQMLDAFCVRGWRRSLFVRWPQAAPFVRAAARTSTGMAWKAGVACELIGLPALSIGEQIYLGKLSLDMASIVAWTVVIIALGWLSERIVIAIVDAASKLPARILDAECAHAKGADQVPSMPSAEAVIINCGWKSFDGQPVLEGFFLEVEKGGVAHLTSPSGSGKTTTLRIIAQLDAFDELSNASSLPMCTSSMAFQEPHLIESLTAPQNLALVASSERELGFARYLLNALIPDEPSLESKPASALSGGQRRRVELARALAHPSSVLLLDEPFSGLDKANARRAAQLIREHRAGRTLIIATHDRSDLA